MAEAEVTSVRSTKTAITVVKSSHPEDVPVQPQEEDGGWKKFIWNGEKGEFLGRTGCSWLLITIFYIIFFICLFGFFVLSWYISVAFLDVKAPYKQGNSSMLSKNGPGMTMRPSPDKQTNPSSSLIWSGAGTYDTFKFWSEQLDTWFSNIPEEGHQNVQNCMEKVKVGGKVTMLRQTTNNKTEGHSCYIDKEWYGPCGDVDDNTFGYDRGEPCILLKMNRVHIKKMIIKLIILSLISITSNSNLNKIFLLI